MADQPGQMDRREFLKSSLHVATGAALIGSGVACETLRPPKRISLSGSLAARPFGTTGHHLPVLGCGGSAMVEK